MLDQTDRTLISLLKNDARMPITSLAQNLGVSRATAQKRLDRLVESGVIRGFTLELSPSAEKDVIRAVMFIELQGQMTRGVVRALSNIPQITSLDSTNGTWDLVAHIEAQNLPQIDSVLRAVRSVQGVTSSETCILLDRA